MPKLVVDIKLVMDVTQPKDAEERDCADNKLIAADYSNSQIDRSMVGLDGL